MNPIYLLVEGENDAHFLRRVLPKELLRDTRLLVAGGAAAIPSLARSVLVRRKCPVAVLMDSDSVDPDVSQERQRSTEDLIRVADSSIPVKVIVVDPEIEAWFLAAPALIERIIGRKVTKKWLSSVRTDPKCALKTLAEKSKIKVWDTDQAIDTLDEQDVHRIREIPEVVALSVFLKEARQPQKADTF